MALNPIKRILRKIPLARAAALAYAKQQRRKSADSHWGYEQSVMVLVGQMVVMWAGIERLLDELIAHHQQQFTDLSEEHPRGLSKKLEYLKSMQRDEKTYPWGSREFFRTMRIEAKRLGNERHEIIHGVMRRIGTSVVWQSQRVIYEGPNARVSAREFHNDDLVRIYRNMRSFELFISPRIWLLIGGDHRNSPGGDIEQVYSELVRTFPPVNIP